MPCAIAYFYNPKFTKTRATPKMKRPIRKIAVQSPIRTVRYSITLNAERHKQLHTHRRPNEQFYVYLVGGTHPEYSSCIYFLFTLATIQTPSSSSFICFLLFFTASFFRSLSGLGVSLFCIDFELCTLFLRVDDSVVFGAHRKMTIVKLINFHIEAHVNAVILFCIVDIDVVRSAKKKMERMLSILCQQIV